MQKSELIEKILEENNGILRLEDALLAGISKRYNAVSWEKTAPLYLI